MADAQRPQAVIRFLGEIRTETVQALLATIDRELKEERQRITLAIKSPGGSAFDTEYLYHQLQEKCGQGMELTTHGRDQVESAAILPFLAGQRRYIEPGTRLLVHPAKHVFGSGNVLLPAETIETLTEMHNHMIVLCLKRHAAMSEEIAWNLASNESYLTPEEAVRLNIAHGIQMIDIPEDVQPVDLFFTKN